MQETGSESVVQGGGDLRDGSLGDAGEDDNLKRRVAALLRRAHSPVVIVGLLTLLAAYFGIATRSAGFIAAFWPANALILGYMVRRPGAATAAGWLVVTAAFVVADMTTGSDFEKTAFLTAANLAAIAAGLVAIRVLLPPSQRQLPSAAAVLRLLGTCVVAACAAGLMGGIANVQIFDGGYLDGVRIWFSAELAHFVVILPAVLSAPWLRRSADPVVAIRGLGKHVSELAGPLVALLAGVGVGVLLGGPAAVALPLPALLWCALRGSVFETSILSVAWLGWTLTAASNGYFGETLRETTAQVESLQLSLAIVTLGPIVTAATVASRNRIMRELEHAATRDDLTGLLTRGTFFSQAASLAGELAANGKPMAVMVVDFDRFKEVNDRHGHASGDEMLASFGTLLADRLRHDDLAGRVGGEEFAVFLADADLRGAVTVAESIREAQEAAGRRCSPEDGGNGGHENWGTVSIGVVEVDLGKGTLVEAIGAADQLMYQAKSAGRNRVVSGLVGPEVA